ncbi:hypothetical protein V6N11_076662 [Hibiscus sabdariffa]|uniref:Uncharacterized protein n=2 Tax=Hibiscus sabdariffa TaxID=183260 RepID=A0ABR2FCM9_9ROSI
MRGPFFAASVLLLGIIRVGVGIRCRRPVEVGEGANPTGTVARRWLNSQYQINQSPADDPKDVAGLIAPSEFRI